MWPECLTSLPGTSVHQSRDVDHVQRFLTESKSPFLWGSGLQTPCKAHMLSPERRQQPGLRLWSVFTRDCLLEAKLNVACGVGQVDRGTTPSRLGFTSLGRTQDGLPLDPSLRESERLSATYTVTGRRLSTACKLLHKQRFSLSQDRGGPGHQNQTRTLACALNSYRVPGGIPHSGQHETLFPPLICRTTSFRSG